MNRKNPNVVLRVETPINAPADKVWEILGRQFEDISKWSSIVQSSHALTAEEVPQDFTPAKQAPVPARQTTTQNKGKTATLIEVVTMYSDEERALKFYGHGLPRFIGFASDKQQVIATGQNQSTVIFDLELRLNGIFKLFKGKVKKRFAENLKKVQEELKVYAEK